MDLQLVPYERLGPIRLGMRRDEVRTVIPSRVEAYQKTPTSVALTDAFSEEGIHVFYNNEDVCIAIEVSSRQCRSSMEEP